MLNSVLYQVKASLEGLVEPRTPRVFKFWGLACPMPVVNPVENWALWETERSVMLCSCPGKA